jgi:hypothetical protein
MTDVEKTEAHRLALNSLAPSFFQTRSSILSLVPSSVFQTGSIILSRIVYEHMSRIPCDIISLELAKADPWKTPFKLTLFPNSRALLKWTLHCP